MIDSQGIIRILESRLGAIDQVQADCTPDAHCAAILVPLLWKDNEWQVLYTRRTGKVSTHQHEVSFPGGAYEDTDETLVNTVLRETFEEIGIRSKDISILGSLQKSQTITGFRVFPFVAVVNWPIEFKVNVDEVESVFFMPISWLQNPNNNYEEDYDSIRFGIHKVIHYMDYHGEHLWGYTARVTMQFLELLK
jgi:8-oxo-dGTP pyrophosphatase MutT (NUDIX family)